MPVAILPAAGSSSRMGRSKLLLPCGATTVVGATVTALRDGGADAVVLVIDPEDEALAAAAAELGVRVAHNPAPERGMLSSVWAGLDALGGAAAVAARGEVLLVCPADLPRLRAATVAAVVRAARTAQAALVVPRRGRARGHPLAIAPELVAEIPGLDPQVGLRQLRLRHLDRTLEIEVADPGVIADVDTPEDYAALRAEPES